MLALYLVLHGYEAKTITILAAYGGQAKTIKNKINSKLEENRELFEGKVTFDCDMLDQDPEADEIDVNKVLVHTIDSYQGMFQLSSFL